MLNSYLELATAVIAVVACWRYLTARKAQSTAYAQWLESIRNRFDQVPATWLQLTANMTHSRWLHLLVFGTGVVETGLLCFPAHHSWIDLSCLLAVAVCCLLVEHFSTQSKQDDQNTYQEHLAQILQSRFKRP